MWNGSCHLFDLQNIGAVCRMWYILRKKLRSWTAVRCRRAQPKNRSPFGKKLFCNGYPFLKLMNESSFGSTQATFQLNCYVVNFVVGAPKFGNVFTMRWQKFITSIWEKNVANKKG